MTEITNQEDGNAALKGRLALMLMPTLIVAELVSSFEGSMIYAALKQFYELYDDPAHIGWLVSGYMLVASIAAAICGRLGDMYGRARVLVIALLISCGGSIISALSTQLEWIIVGRSIQGLAGAILPLCYGLVRQHCAPGRMKINIGIVSATASAGAGIGLILGGMLVDQGSWRLIFIASACLALVAAIMVLPFISRDRSKNASEPIDWLGAVLFIVGMGSLLYAVAVVGDHGWGSREQVGLGLLSLVTLAIWAWYEFRHDDPMINVRMLGLRQIWVTLSIFVLAGLGALNISQVVMVMLQQPVATGVGLGQTATVAGVVHAPASILGVVSAPFAGWLAGKHGGRIGMIMAMASISTAWIGLAFAHDSVWLAGLWMAVNGFGVGALMAATPILIVEVSPADRVSEATGLAQIVRKIAMACGAQAVAVSLASSTVAVAGGIYPSSDAYFMTYSIIATLCVTGLLLCLGLPRRSEWTNEELPTGSAVLGGHATTARHHDRT